MNKKFGLFAFLSIFIICVALKAQTSTNLRHIYDEAGQLVGVIDENNNATAYNYDAVGNLVSIERLPVRGAVDIFFVEPNRGKAAALPRPGTPVTIHGLGFSAVPAQNQVTFNGVAAVVEEATTTMIRTTVPAGATTGPVQVMSPLGMIASRRDFVVIAAITVTVSPARATVVIGERQQFTATLREGDTIIQGNVFWSVNGVRGGNPMVGTITSNGLYTAPVRLPTPYTVTVTATSVEEPTSSGNATVIIALRINPVYTQGASYRIATPDPFPVSPVYTQGASYRIATPDLFPMSPIYTQGASYRIARPDQFPVSPIYTQGASYRIDMPDPAVAAPIFDQGASYTTIAITGLDPARAARGTTDRPFTVRGRDLNGATALDFVRPDGVRDSNITVANLLASPDGTLITARITVAGTTEVGARTVVVRTPMGYSTNIATMSNQLLIE